jgi:hypothetical protein
VNHAERRVKGTTPVVIKRLDKWSTGDDLADLAEYATAQGAEGYEAHEVRLSRCATCGGQVFGVHGDLSEHAAKRICRGCGAEHFIVDSGEYWDEDAAGIMVCECSDETEGEDFNVAVAYSLYADRAGIRAIAITSRCTACGQLGYWDDWMIRTADMHRLDLA